MIDISNLRAIIMLSYLTDPMPKKLEEITLIKKYGEKEYIFQEGEYAEHLFAVIEGRVSLELAKNPSRHIAILEVTKGMAFGMASLVDTGEQEVYRLCQGAGTYPGFRLEGSRPGQALGTGL